MSLILDMKISLLYLSIYLSICLSDMIIINNQVMVEINLQTRKLMTKVVKLFIIMIASIILYKVIVVILQHAAIKYEHNEIQKKVLSLVTVTVTICTII